MTENNEWNMKSCGEAAAAILVREWTGLDCDYCPRIGERGVGHVWRTKFAILVHVIFVVLLGWNL